jgi:hypothetical protein
VSKADELRALLERVEKKFGPDRDLDSDIAEALGASICRVTKLGLTGRTRGGFRAFWPSTKTPRGAPIPYYTKDRHKAAALLRALISQTEDTARGG